MAKNFKAAMRKKREGAAVPQQQAETAVHERELELPKNDLQQSELQVNRPADEPAGQIIRVGIDEVYAEEQVRPEEDFEEETIEGMSQSYDEFGILTPPRCYPRDKRGYRIWMGETRWRSAKRHGDQTIDIYVGLPPENDTKRIYGQLIENIHQSGLKPLATAIQLKKLRDEHGETQEAIARKLGIPKALVSKYLRLVNAPDAVIALLRDKVTKDVDLVYTLCQINDINPQSVEKLASMARTGKLTRQTAIKELNVLKGKPDKNKKPPEPPAGQVEPSAGQVSDRATDSKPVGDENRSSETTIIPSPAAAADDVLCASEEVTQQLTEVAGHTPAGNVQKPKVPRIVVKFEDSEGYLLTEQIPDEFGQVWVELSVGTICVDAADISILGIKEV
ncbi:ParB/RepB/Spo0J family partition protein [Serratia bockelmannii]|uniref:ParB/RepB/Spo0J family partition protein n=1 Tax=Serratia bockelmannii TaxID=2703793 RepID=A0ABT8M096_9GAMM|nr:ParB/RepB/Spo0J family partition protein [Serratia bockelmannii]MDN6881818.1 ParB/RepB/Spo0J family partition protein [Serratia bockelmannii]HBH6890306.1 ParB/RepB/Spo0J family partition protein [Serratia marcescens]